MTVTPAGKPVLPLPPWKRTMEPPAPPHLTVADLVRPRQLAALLDESPSTLASEGYEELLVSPGKDRDAISLYSRPYGEVPGVNEYLCIGEAPVTADTMFRVLMDAEYRLTWDTSCEKHTNLENYASEENITHSLNYWLVKYPFPLSRRDYCYERITQFEPGAGDKPDVYYLVTAAAKSPKAPEIPKFVRVVTSRTAYALRSAVRDDGKPMCRFVYTAIDDPRGAIPKWVITLLATKTFPSVMKGMFEACQNYKK